MDRGGGRSFEFGGGKRTTFRPPAAKELFMVIGWGGFVRFFSGRASASDAKICRENHSTTTQLLGAAAVKVKHGEQIRKLKRT